MLLKTASAVAISAAVFLSSSALIAADIRDGGGSKDTFVSVNKVDFDGAYVGVGVGGQFANVEIGSGAFDGIGADGLVAEGIAGFDVRRGSFVFGPRVFGAFTNVNTTVGGADLANIDAYVNFGGRAGIVFNRTLVYAHAGYEMMWLSSDSPWIDSVLNDADTNAATAGLGIETMLVDNVSLAVEGTYLHGLDDAEGGEAGRGVVRLNYQF